MNTFCIITCGRNCGPWLINNFGNTRNQNYDKDHVRVCVTDDASTDGSSNLIAQVCDENKWTCFINKDRRYALANQYRAIHSICKDDTDVIVFVDMDDWLNGPNVLSTLGEVYSDPDVLLTYGSFVTHPNPDEKAQSVVRNIPPEISHHSLYRSFQKKNGIYWNHLRTFRYGPFCEITQDELKYPSGPKAGRFFTASPDTALMNAVLEMVGPRYRRLNEQLLVYNSVTESPDWKVHQPEIHEADSIILSQPIKPLWRPTQQLADAIARVPRPASV